MIIFAFIIIWMSECTESCIVARKLTCVSPYCLLQEIALVEMFRPCDQIPGPPAFEIHPHHPLHLLKSILWRVQIWKFPFPFNSSHLNLPAKVNILLTFMSSRYIYVMKQKFRDGICPTHAWKYQCQRWYCWGNMLPFLKRKMSEHAQWN